MAAFASGLHFRVSMYFSTSSFVYGRSSQFLVAVRASMARARLALWGRAGQEPGFLFCTAWFCSGLFSSALRTEAEGIDKISVQRPSTAKNDLI